MGMGGPGVWDATEGYKRQGVVEVVGRHCHCAVDDCVESVAFRVVDAYFYFEARRFSVGGSGGESSSPDWRGQVATVARPGPFQAAARPAQRRAVRVQWLRVLVDPQFFMEHEYSYEQSSPADSPVVRNQLQDVAAQ